MLLLIIHPMKWNGKYNSSKLLVVGRNPSYCTKMSNMLMLESKRASFNNHQ